MWRLYQPPTWQRINLIYMRNNQLSKLKALLKALLLAGGRLTALRYQ
jgi:hypothetical protein